MNCVKCSHKMIPFGSPEKRRKQRYAIYLCQNCGNTGAIIKTKQEAK